MPTDPVLSVNQVRPCRRCGETGRVLSDDGLLMNIIDLLLGDAYETCPVCRGKGYQIVKVPTDSPSPQ